MSTCQVAMATARFVSSFLISTSSALYYNCATLPIPPPTDKTNVVYLLRPIDGNALNLLFFFFSLFSLFIQRAQKKHKERTNNNELSTVKKRFGS